MLEAAAARHGIDAELLLAMAQVESAGNPDAESSSGALGLMQVMPASAPPSIPTMTIHPLPERRGET